MFIMEKLNEVISQLGGLSDAQKDILYEAAETPIGEKELFEKLGVDEKQFSVIMKAFDREDEVFRQEVSEEELSAVSGGTMKCRQTSHFDCPSAHYHLIYEPSFPSCVKTVEDGSWCFNVDACYGDAIEYVGMTDCSKAWR